MSGKEYEVWAHNGCKSTRLTASGLAVRAPGAGQIVVCSIDREGTYRAVLINYPNPAQKDEMFHAVPAL